MKKFLLLFTAAACVGLASCSETLSEEDKQLEEIQKKFDFSEVNTEGLEIKTVYGFQDHNGPIIGNSLTGGVNPFIYSHPDLVAVIGEINKCLWLGLFDRESGKLKYQYMDIEHPISYSAYGVEYEYGVGRVLGIYFEGNDIAIAIQYPKYESTKARLDLIAFDKNNKVSRTTIAEETYCYTGMVMIDQWANNAICFCDLVRWAIIYDIDKSEVLCYGYDEKLLHAVAAKLYPEIDGNIFISNTDLLHFWNIFCGRALSITEYQCTYDTVATTIEYVELFDTYTGDSLQVPRYSVEYQIKTDDHIFAIITQTEYDGTVTTKTVDIRLENDELKIEIQ